MPKMTQLCSGRARTGIQHFFALKFMLLTASLVSISHGGLGCCIFSSQETVCPRKPADGHLCITGGWMDGWMDGWMLVDKCWWIHYRFMWVNVWMDEWVNGWKDRRIDGWMDELGGKLGG